MVDPPRSETPSSDRSDRVLEILERRSGETTVGDLAEAVFRAECRTESHAAVHEDLFCRVLPSLAERGELGFDVDRGVVVLDRGDPSLLQRLPAWLSW